MSSRLSLPEEDLTCPVCCDIFRDPVLLPCSHSFCRVCLQHSWEVLTARSCPVCRSRSSWRNPPANLALRNLCEAFTQGRVHREANEGRQLCPQHGEKLKLFCQKEQLPICVVCQTSKAHKGHECLPLEEAAIDCRTELKAALKTLQDQLAALNNIRSNADMTLEHIKAQAQSIGKRIKDQFLRLHQFLFEKEKAALLALRKEEEERLQAVKEKAVVTAEKIDSLSETIRILQQEVSANDLTVLQNFQATMERVQGSEPEHEMAAGLLMDEAKHLGNLKSRVWEKMRSVAPHFPVTLDPNTAHPCLCLSDDLTGLQYGSLAPHLPGNPERFRVSAEVLGSTGFRTGRHSWVVDTTTNEDWILGLAYRSVQRNAEVFARPENGFWTLCLRDGVYRAMTSPPTVLTLSGKPKQIRVELDWEGGEVTFTDPEEDTTLYTLTQTFEETVLPYFCTRSKHPLRISPEPAKCHQKSLESGQPVKSSDSFCNGLDLYPD
ncbi:zinc-binding protein A33-like isoform X2 [Clupea harengus]|uniref:Zinc-binding protein A33-like isoform X2 n=1 Tax=Clupea harengus TaxID=7950 RepID=A0A6P8FW50_CLUHA|nr:zinc-binding protein A33-like isoform X2 [Clupea harengus]